MSDSKIPTIEAMVCDIRCKHIYGPAMNPDSGLIALLTPLYDALAEKDALIRDAKKIIPALLAIVHTCRMSVGGKDGKLISEWLKKTEEAKAMDELDKRIYDGVLKQEMTNFNELKRYLVEAKARIAELEAEVGRYRQTLDEVRAGVKKKKLWKLIAEARGAMDEASSMYHRTVMFGGQRPGAETFMKNLYKTFKPIDEWLDKTKGYDDGYKH